MNIGVEEEQKRRWEERTGLGGWEEEIRGIKNRRGEEDDARGEGWKGRQIDEEGEEEEQGERKRRVQYKI